MGAHELAFVGLAGSGLGTALGVPMVWPRARHSLDVRLLGTAVLLMSAIGALISARLAGLAPASTTVEHAINVLGLCTFPLLVLYTRHSREPRVALRHAAWWWTPAAAYIAFVIVCTALGVSSRVSFARLLPVVLGFTAASIAMLWTYRHHPRTGVVPAEWIVGFVVVLNVAQIVRMEFGHVALVRALVPLVLSIGFIAIAAFAAWRTVALTGVAASEPAAAPRYERSGLEDSVAAELLDRIDRALTADRLFARADLTLAHLAAAVGATAHQVSEVLNRYANVSFHDLINRRRVDDVKAQLSDPASEGFTIEGIGASAGFGSRSALYAAFRRFEGTTPTAFRVSARRSHASSG
jgi:AraC-like DNA-binding protein